MRYLFILLFSPLCASAQFSKEIGLDAGVGLTTVTTYIPGSRLNDGPVFRFVYDAVFDKWDNVFYLTAGFRYSISGPVSSLIGIAGVFGLQHAFQIGRDIDFRYGVNFGPTAEFGGGNINVAAEFPVNVLIKEKYSIGLVYQQPFLPYKAWNGSSYDGSRFIVNNLMIELKKRLYR